MREQMLTLAFLILGFSFGWMVGAIIDEILGE